MLRIGIVAPSSAVPPVEFALGMERLKESGVTVFVHPQADRQHLFFAGTDTERATAFYEFALNSNFSVVWCARGGYGAPRILPLLDRLTAERGIPEKKLLVGYSDATALLEYVRTHWNWATLHAPMPGLREFSGMGRPEWEALLKLVRGKTVARIPALRGRLKFVGKRPAQAVEAPLVGGNLAVWASLLGTPFSPRARGRILFLEDITESLPRIDRMAHQLLASGVLEGVRAIILGTFHHCDDAVSSVLLSVPSARLRRRVVSRPKPSELGPLRERISRRAGLSAIFGELGERLRVPVAMGLPVGHGTDGMSPLPLGAKYRLEPSGRLSLVKWDWKI